MAMDDLSNFEFRHARPDEMEDYLRIVRYVFGDDPEELEDDEFPMQPSWTWVGCHKGKIVSTSGGYPFIMRLNGCDVEVDGVSNIGTDPAYRRRGLVRRLVTDRLQQAHEAGRPAAVLYASYGAIYQRFGYGLASGSMYCNFDPRFAALQFGEKPEGQMERITRDRVEGVCADSYTDFMRKRSLMMQRNDRMWKFVVRKGAQCAVHRDETGRVDGYLVYRLREFKRSTGPYGEMPGEPDPDQRLEIQELVWTDIKSFRALWEYVRAHDLVGSVTYNAPVDDPAWSMLLEPRVLKPLLYEGIWLRVTDLKSLLQSRLYDHAGSVSLQVDEDAACPWNAGTWRLDAGPGGQEVTPVGGTGEVRISIAGLASLITGHFSLSHLVRIGRASVSDPARLPLLDALFSTRYAPFCLTDF